MLKNLRHYQTDSDEEKIWLTVYSDMITNLMLFFLMLYGLSRMTPEKRADIMRGMEDKFRGKADVEVRAERVLKNVREQDVTTQVNNLVENQDLAKYTSVEINEHQIKITLNAPVLFASGDAGISASTKATLSEVARVLSAVPNQIIIEGHTDNQPIMGGKYLSNWELSVARAYSVIEYFVNEKKLSPERFIAAGYGEYRPLISNETPEGKAKNRRIEIVLRKN